MKCANEACEPKGLRVDHSPDRAANAPDDTYVSDMQVAMRWNRRPGDPDADFAYDLGRDGDIDMVDVMSVARD